MVGQTPWHWKIFKIRNMSTARHCWNSCQPVLGQSSESINDLLYLAPIWYHLFQETTVFKTSFPKSQKEIKKNNNSTCHILPRKKKSPKIKALHLRQSSGHFYQAFSKWLQQPLALGASPAAVLPWVEGPWVPSAPPPRFQPRGEVRWHCWRQKGKCPRRGWSEVVDHVPGRFGMEWIEWVGDFKIGNDDSKSHKTGSFLQYHDHETEDEFHLFGGLPTSEFWNPNGAGDHDLRK